MTIGNNYPNPLDRHRTFSYHFILTAASTTEALRKMVGNEGKALLSAVQSAQLGDSFSVGGSNAFLVADTRRFSQYSITDVEMEHVYGTGDRVNPSVPTSLMSMKMIDTTGLSFFPFMMDLFRNKLKTTRASAFFLLSILFVGHTDDGQTETISTCHIPLLLISMGFEFTHKGSEYEIEFLEIEGAPQRGAPMQQINYMGAVNSITTKKDGANTVGELIDDLEEQLNKQSKEHFQKFTKEGGGKLGKMVQYMITIPESGKYNWKQFKVTGANRSRNIEQKYKSDKPTEGGKDNTKKPVELTEIKSDTRYSQISFSNTTTITDAIKIILESSQEFHELASREKVKNGDAVAFKTVTSITSDDSTYTLHFDIYPYRIPKVESNQGTLTAGTTSKNVVGSADQVKNLITYDYIYTGANSHILDLKIKYNPESAVAFDTQLEIGSSRLNFNSAAGQQKAKVKEVSSGAGKSTVFSPHVRDSDPVFLPMRSKDELNNNNSQKGTEELSKEKSVEAFKAKQEYTQTMASLHFLSSIELNLSVRGNPNIIRKYADREERGGIAPHYDPSSKKKYISEYVQPRIDAYDKSSSNDSLINKVDVSTLPIFVKLNILAPDVDWTGQYKNSSKLFTDAMFFNGPYQILFIKSVFSGGNFTHDMTLIPFDVSGSYTTSKDNGGK